MKIPPELFDSTGSNRLVLQPHHVLSAPILLARLVLHKVGSIRCTPGGQKARTEFYRLPGVAF